MKITTIPLRHTDTNCYVAVDEKSGEAVVIDPGEFTQRLVNAIDGEEIKVKYILLTHGHYDHILGVYDLKEKTGAKVAIHGLDASCLRDEKDSLMDYIKPGIQKPCEADVILEEGSEIKFGDSVLTVMHTPGHTKGSVCFVCEEDRTVFTGDTLFCRTYGRTDLPGGDDEAMTLSLERLRMMHGEYFICTGHGMTTTLDKERIWNRRMKRLK